MRSFFKSELETLKAKTGLNQYENMSDMPDAKTQFKVLLDELEKVCSWYPMIPEDQKKRIVSEKIITDPEFNNLNAKVVSKWFMAEKNAYLSIQERSKDSGPVVFDPLNEVTIKKLNEFWDNLKDNTKPNYSGLSITIDAIKDEDATRLKGEEIKPKGTSSGMPSWTVPIIDDEGNLLKEISNVLAPTMEKAIQIVELSIRQGDLKI